MNKRSKSDLHLKLAQQNAELHDKIQRSKPILQTIYDKVKRKQKVLYDKINREKRLITDYKNVANDYKKLYQETIKIIQKNKVIDKFDHSLSNFARTKNKVLGKQQTLKSKSLYEQYRERINQGLMNVPQEKNPELEVLKRQNEELKNQMINDIDKLKVVRAKSQKALGKSKSTSYFKFTKARGHQIEQLAYKKRVAQRESRKLHRVQV